MLNIITTNARRVNSKLKQECLENDRLRSCGVWDGRIPSSISANVGLKCP